MKYEIRFWFDFGGICLWAMNDKAKEKYGYAIEVQELELSNQLEKELLELQKEFETYLDMRDPMAPTSWSNEKKEIFLKRALKIGQELQRELGPDYKIINEVKENVCLIT